MKSIEILTAERPNVNALKISLQNGPMKSIETLTAERPNVNALKISLQSRQCDWADGDR